MLSYISSSARIGVDFGGSPGAHPQYLRNAHAVISFYHIFPQNNLGLPLQIYASVCVQ